VAQKYHINVAHQSIAEPFLLEIHENFVFFTGLTAAFLKSWKIWNKKAGNFGLQAKLKPETFWRKYETDYVLKYYVVLI
jgi:hypothetical protein